LQNGYNHVYANDLGGGIKSDYGGENWIYSNSIFDSSDSGAFLTNRDIFMGNMVVDNQKHGVTIVNRDNVFLVGNVVKNNSLESDNTYHGIEVSGYGGAVNKATLIGNRCWNRDPTLAGSGNGLQDCGIFLDYDINDSLIFGNNLTTDFGETTLKKGASYSPSNVLLGKNLGYKTVNYGSTSVADGDTIAHGLAEEPTIVILETMSTNQANPSAKDGTNITVSLVDQTGSAVTTAETVFWRAWI